MPTLPTAFPIEEARMDARAYKRAHTGKLMVITHESNTAPTAADFFKIEDVGTHPTGLFVTGIFENERRSHMRAATVRDATEEEIAWRNHSKN